MNCDPVAEIAAGLVPSLTDTSKTELNHLELKHEEGSVLQHVKRH